MSQFFISPFVINHPIYLHKLFMNWVCFVKLIFLLPFFVSTQNIVVILFLFSRFKIEKNIIWNSRLADLVRLIWITFHYYQYLLNSLIRFWVLKVEDEKKIKSFYRKRKECTFFLLKFVVHLLVIQLILMIILAKYLSLSNQLWRLNKYLW